MADGLTIPLTWGGAFATLALVAIVALLLAVAFNSLIGARPMSVRRFLRIYAVAFIVSVAVCAGSFAAIMATGW